MNIHRVSLLLAFAVGLVLSGSACRRASAPPTPLPIAEVPAEIQKVFAQAAPGAKDIATEVAKAAKEKNYPAAYQGLQILVSLHDATPEQRTVAARAMLAITTLLQEAQAKGDPAAAEALRAQRISK
jgi:hypothetical protein